MSSVAGSLFHFEEFLCVCTCYIFAAGLLQTVKDNLDDIQLCHQKQFHSAHHSSLNKLLCNYNSFSKVQYFIISPYYLCKLRIKLKLVIAEMHSLLDWFE